MNTPSTWRKSSYSGQYSDNCIECASSSWRKATASSDSFACVEAAELASDVAVRDSKDPTGPVLHFHGDSWRAFIDAVKRDALHPGHYRNG